MNRISILTVKMRYEDKYLLPVVHIDVTGVISFEQFTIKRGDDVLSRIVIVAKEIEKFQQIIVQLVGRWLQYLDGFLVVNLRVCKFKNGMSEFMVSVVDEGDANTYRRNILCWCWTAMTAPTASTSTVESTKSPKLSFDMC